LAGRRLLAGILLLSAATGFSLNALAAELKIGVVDARAILDKAPQAEMARKRMDEEFAPRDQKLVEAQKSLRSLEQQLASEGDMMSESQRRILERDIIAKRRELRRSAEELREDINIRRNEELNKLQKEIIEAIASLAKEENFDIILNHTAAVYWSERVDLTEKVLQRLAR